MERHAELMEQGVRSGFSRAAVLFQQGKHDRKCEEQQLVIKSHSLQTDE